MFNKKSILNKVKYYLTLEYRIPTYSERLEYFKNRSNLERTRNQALSERRLNMARENQELIENIYKRLLKEPSEIFGGKESFERQKFIDNHIDSLYKNKH